MVKRNFIKAKDIKKIKVTDDATIFYTKDECFVCEKDHVLPKPEDYYFELHFRKFEKE